MPWPVVSEIPMNYVVSPAGAVHAVGAALPRLSPGFGHVGPWTGPSHNPRAAHLGRRGTLAGQVAPMQAPVSGFSFGTLLLAGAAGFALGALVGGYLAWSACLGKAVVTAAVPALAPKIIPHLLGSGSGAQS